MSEVLNYGCAFSLRFLLL